MTKYQYSIPLCDELELQPTQIYGWQKQLFENAALAFQKPGKQDTQQDIKDRKIEALQAKIQQKTKSWPTPDLIAD